MRRVLAASLVAISASAQAPAAPVAQAPTICGNQPLCYEAPDFAATITDFRTSAQGRIIDIAVRFTNKTSNLLVLGYTNGSGVATDERGNRYVVWGGNGVRGMGFVNGQSVDPKFQINPGGYGDTRFELGLQGYPPVIGFTFEFDLSVNEINAYQGNQYTVGSEFPLTWKGLANGASGAAPAQVAVAGGGAGTTGSTLTSIPCQNSTVQNVANGANNAASQVSSAVSSIGSLFGKKPKPQAASSSTPTVPCTPAQTATTGTTATTTTTSTGAVVTNPAPATTAAPSKAVATMPTAATTAKPAATTAKPAATTAKPAAAPQPAVPTAPAKKPVPVTTQPANTKPATTQPANTQPAPPKPNQ